MVFENDCTELIISMFPEFIASKHWNEYLEFWGTRTDASLHSKISAFSDFATDVLNKKIIIHNPKRIFDFIERMMIEGDQSVREAVATCFLENLINYTSYGDLHSKQFIHFLGHESREYCKAWDEFTGVKTDGLWD